MCLKVSTRVTIWISLRVSECSVFVVVTVKVTIRLSCKLKMIISVSKRVREYIYIQFNYSRLL